MLFAPPRAAVRRARSSPIRRRPLATLPTRPTLTPRTQGQLLAITAFLAAGAGQVLAKGVYQQGAEPAAFLVVRLSAAVALLLLLCRHELLAIPARRRWTLLAIGAGFGAQTIAYFSALERAPVALVVVVAAAYPIVVMAQDAIADRVLPSPPRMVIMGVALAGLWLAAGRPAGMPDLGVGLALLSAVGYATYLRLSHRALTDVRPMVATAWVLTGALVTVVGVALVAQPSWPSPAGLGLAALHGVAATTLPIVAIYAALQRLPTADIAALGPLEPVLATGMAAALLGEVLTLPQLVGGTIVIVAVTRLAGVRPRFALPRLPFAVPRASAPLRRRRRPDEVVRVATSTIDA